MSSKPLVAASLALFAFAAGAQNLKPGLWEVSHKMQGGGPTGPSMAQMQQQMANMPPEQRKMMQEMMAKQGVQMAPGAAAGGMSVRICMTREMVEKNEIPAQQGDCKTTQQSRSGNTMKMAFTCVNPPSSGQGEMTFVSPEAYSMKMAMNATVNGKPEKMNMEGAGKWLGSDCGKVTPVAPPKK
jgi:hypothetical protein